jgi:Zn-dependent protease with chaperone function
MAVSTRTSPRAGGRDSARTVAVRVDRAGVALAALGLGTAAFWPVRLLGTWRVGSASAGHLVLFGERLSYPRANVAALLVLLLAAVGLVSLALAIWGAAREAVAAARLGRRLARSATAAAGARVIADDRPLAFCAGLARPRVYVSTGALALLDEPALEAVLAHERHHARRRDPLRLASGRVLTRALFFMPGLAELGRQRLALAEIGADEAAIAHAAGSRRPLATAMLAFAESGAGGFDPERVDHILGGGPQTWRFPATLCLLASSAVLLLLALGLLAGRVAAGSATLAPPFLARQPCVVMLALLPLASAITAWRIRRRLGTRAAPAARAATSGSERS